MVAFLELPPELQREIVTYCNTASQLACCLTSHTLLENSRPTLYHRIQLDDHRVQVFVARALHHIALVRRLHASFGGISGPHIAETEWVILLEGLIQCQALETLDLIPSGYNFTQQSKVIDVTLERLSLLPSLRSVMDMFPSTQERLPEPASWHRLFYWGTRLNGARMRIHYGELLPLAVKLPNRPILHTLQIDGKFQPWNSFEPPFEFHSLRYLSIVLDDGFDNLYEEILNAASASLQRVSFAWLIGGRETGPTFLHLAKTFEMLTIITLALPNTPLLYIPPLSVKTFLNTIMERAPNLRTLQIYFINRYRTQSTPGLPSTADNKPWDILAEIFCKFPFTKIQLWFSYDNQWDDQMKGIAQSEIRRSFRRILRNPGRLEIFWHRKIQWREVWEGNLIEEDENVVDLKVGTRSGDHRH